MEGGGHYDWGQEIDTKKWERTVSELISRLRKKHRIAFLCHNENEVSLAQKMCPNLPYFLPKTTKDYLNCVEHAKFGVCNRMHASIGMAGLGIHSVAVCTDTRLLMVDAIGLPIHYVKNVDEDILEHEIETGLSLRQKGKERLLYLRKKTWKEYIDIIDNTINNNEV
jgi:hypothetical protein